MNKYSDMYRPSTSATSFRRTMPAASMTATQSFRGFPLCLPSQSWGDPFGLLPKTPSTRNEVLSRENLRATLKAESLNALAERTQRATPTLSLTLPNGHDIARLLDNLNGVTSKKPTVHRTVLPDAVPTSFTLAKDSVQFFSVVTKGRAVPLTMKIHKAKGSVRCYMSRTVAEPSSVLADMTFRGNSFKVTDSGLTFKCNQLYFAIHAVEEFEGVFEAQFGSFKSARVIAQSVGCTPEPESPSKTFGKSGYSSKNFIHRNLDPVPLNSPSRQTFHFQKGQDWAVRRKLVVEKKKLHLQQKKERTIALLNKHEEKRERERKIREEVARYKQAQARERQWLKWLYVVSAISKLREVTHAGRQTVLSRLRRSNSIRKIQTAFKQSTSNVFASQVGLARALNALRLFQNCCSAATTLSTRRNIVVFAQDSFSNTALAKNVERLTQSVLFIQSTWRIALKRTKEQLFQLGTLWNKVALKMSNETKKKKNRQQMAQKYIMISLNDKNRTLQEYLLGRKRKYQRLIQICINNSILQRAKIASALTHTNSQNLVRDSLPPFRFLPSEEKMRKLIRSAL